MAFCKNCGAEVNDKAVVCVKCGVALEVKPKGEAWSTGAMIALVIGSLLIPLVGLGFGLWGRGQPDKKDQANILLILGLVSWFIACSMVM